jgi:hypothetical protein
MATNRKESKEPYIMLGNIERRLGLTIDAAMIAAIPIDIEIGTPKMTKMAKIIANQALAVKVNPPYLIDFRFLNRR